MTGIAGWGALAGGLAQGYQEDQRTRYGIYRGSEQVKADIQGAKNAADVVAKLAQANPDDKGLQMMAAVHRAYTGGAVPKVTATGAGVNPAGAQPPGSNPAVTDSKSAADYLEKMYANDPQKAAMVAPFVSQMRAYGEGLVPKVTAAGAGVNPSTPANPATAASPAGQAQTPSPGGASTSPGNTDQMYP